MSANCDNCGRDVYPASVRGLCLDCWSNEEIDNWAKNRRALKSPIPDSIPDAECVADMKAMCEQVVIKLKDKSQ